MRTGGLQKHHRRSEERRSRSESQQSETNQPEQATPPDVPASQTQTISPSATSPTGDQTQTNDIQLSPNVLGQTITVNGDETTFSEEPTVQTSEIEDGDQTSGM